MIRHSIAIALFATSLAAAQPKLAFEVVSIKPVPRPTAEAVRDGISRVGFNIEGDRVEIFGYGLNVLIARAFGVEAAQVDLRGLGGANFFEVQAKMPVGTTPAQVPEMLQTMLSERFKLAYHRESREYPVTVLTLGKNGIKLQRLPDDTKPSTHTEGRNVTQIGTVGSLLPVLASFGGLGQMVDETGLEGIYRWNIVFPPAPVGQNPLDSMREGFTNMLDEAGLKIEGRKVMEDTIVVDRVERLPTEN